MTFREIDQQQYRDVARIYQEGIATGSATFETLAPSWPKWDAGHLAHSRLALYNDDSMVGWAALSAVSGRCVYAGVAEVSVYVGSLFRGQGYGEKLLNELIRQSEIHGLWTLQSGIFEENLGSQRLHLKCGFRSIGYRERIGKLGNTWKNNLIMERRSQVNGID